MRFESEEQRQIITCSMLCLALHPAGYTKTFETYTYKFGPTTALYDRCPNLISEAITLFFGKLSPDKISLQHADITVHIPHTKVVAKVTDFWWRSLQWPREELRRGPRKFEKSGKYNVAVSLQKIRWHGFFDWSFQNMLQSNGLHSILSETLMPDSSDWL